MTAALAFSAAYSDFKLIKTRGCVSISFEIPLKDVDLAYQVLGGMPDSAKEQWFGIAALVAGAGASPAGGLMTNEKRAEQHNPGGENEVIPHVSHVHEKAAAGQDTPAPDRPHSPRKPVAAEKRLAQQCGILCADRIFWRFLREGWRVSITSEAEAAAAVRELCAIGSRKELVPGSPAAEQWIKIESRFTAWKLAA